MQARVNNIIILRLSIHVSKWYSHANTVVIVPIPEPCIKLNIQRLHANTEKDLVVKFKDIITFWKEKYFVDLCMYKCDRYSQELMSGAHKLLVFHRIIFIIDSWQFAIQHTYMHM